MNAEDYAIVPGMYVASWPNKTISVVYYESAATISRLFWDLDCFGDPCDAKLYYATGACVFDVESGRTKSRKQRVSVEWADRHLCRISFPDNILEIAYQQRFQVTVELP